MEGFLLVHKPAGVTSRHCVNHIFNVIKSSTGNKAKIGHAGTLDLFASGLLIVGISRIATREIDRIMTLDKRYAAKARLGELTDTLDCTGTVLAEYAIPQDAIAALAVVAANFGAAYLQMPPVYSALKHRGYRLSDLARSNCFSAEQLQRILCNKRRMVEIYHLSISACELPPFFTLQAHVSHGAYIRTLVDDIAQRVNMRATTHELVRTSIGPFSLDKATILSDIMHREDIEKNIVSVETMLQVIERYQKKDKIKNLKERKICRL